MIARRRSWRFWLVLAATLAGMALTFSLGRWQIGRAAQKEALQSAIALKEQQTPLSAHVLSEPLPPERARELLHRLVTIRGTWLPEFTIYLDNRQMAGRQGFDVLTPLRLAGSNAVVLVQRGWAPRSFVDRTALPAVQTPPGLVEFQGRIAMSPPRLYALGEEGRGIIRQNLDLEAFRRETGLPLVDVSVLQIGPPSEGLLREWAQPSTGVEKHYGYAFQWFGLCTLIGLLFLWFQFKPAVVRLFSSRKPHDS